MIFDHYWRLGVTVNPFITSTMNDKFLVVQEDGEISSYQLNDPSM